MMLQVVQRLAVYLRLSIDMISIREYPELLHCARADIGLFFVTLAEICRQF